MDEKFNLFLKELLSWNKKFNLTAITDKDQVIQKHFLDSLLVLDAYPITNQSIVDIGTGAGFPGIPIKIAKPDIKLTLIDSVKKKTKFLKHLISVLNLNSVSIIWGRAEDIAKEQREVYDIAVCRALAPLNVLLEYCLPFVKVGGAVIVLKSKNIEDEISVSSNALKILGGKIESIKELVIPKTDILRKIVIIKKESKTPEKYPRRAGLAKKNPL